MAYYKQKLFPWILPKRAVIYNRVAELPITRHPFASFATSSHEADFFLHTCAVDAEPLHRYKKGGYHPIGLGDLLKDGRYRILHKLGWGGYSTVWAARDQRFDISFILFSISIYVQSNNFPGMRHMLPSKYVPLS